MDGEPHFLLPMLSWPIVCTLCLNLRILQCYLSTHFSGVRSHVLSNKIPSFLCSTLVRVPSLSENKNQFSPKNQTLALLDVLVSTIEVSYIDNPLKQK